MDRWNGWMDVTDTLTIVHNTDQERDVDAEPSDGGGGHGG